MTLSSNKCYIAYHLVQLLGYVVNRFGLFTLSEKVSAVVSMEFPQHLKDLKTFIGLSGYYHHFIARYVTLIKPLQKRKTTMLKRVQRHGRCNKNIVNAFKLNSSTKSEKTSFRLIKDTFCSPTLLIHHNQCIPLLIYVDSSMKGGFAVTIH